MSPKVACLTALIILAACLGVAAQGSAFTTAIFQVVCNDTNAPPFDARCNQSSSSCTTTSLPMHVCLNSTEYNVSVKILDCYSFPSHHYPPNIVVAVYEGTRTCERVEPVIQHQPIGKCIPVENNVFVQNMCSNPGPSPSSDSSASSSSSSEHSDAPTPVLDITKPYLFVDGRRYALAEVEQGDH
jgi:hypothetical protein